MVDNLCKATLHLQLAFCAACVEATINEYITKIKVNRISRLKYQNDLVVNLQHEKEKFDQVCEEEEKHINRMKHVLYIIEE